MPTRFPELRKTEAFQGQPRCAGEGELHLWLVVWTRRLHPLRFIGQNLTPHRDGVRRWSFGKVNRVKWCHESSLLGFLPLSESSETLCPLSALYQLRLQQEAGTQSYWHPDLVFLFFCLFKIEPTANRGSQAGGWIRAVAVSYAIATATPDLSCICEQHHSSKQCQILTHWAGPRIEPASLWILVRFVSAEPLQELLCFVWFGLVWLHLQHMEVPRPGIEAKTQLQPTP